MRRQLTRDLLGRLRSQAPLHPVAPRLFELTVGIAGEVLALPIRVEKLRIALGGLLGPGRSAHAEPPGDRGRRRGEQEHPIRRACLREPEEESGRGDDPVVRLDRPRPVGRSVAKPSLRFGRFERNGVSGTLGDLGQSHQRGHRARYDRGHGAEQSGDPDPVEHQGDDERGVDLAWLDVVDAAAVERS